MTRWRAAVHHPLTSLVGKSALAAGSAFWLGSFLPGELGEYRYYAALGAYSVIYPAVSDSLRQAARAMAAVLLGVVIAMVVQLAAWTNPLTVAVAVGVAVGLGAVRWLRDQASWVPVVALFVLAVGGARPEGYAAGYVAQLLLGALVGLAVNFLVFPPLPVHELESSILSLRQLLVLQLRALASAVAAGRAPGAGTGTGSAASVGGPAGPDLRELVPARERVRRAVAEARRARQGNPRASRSTRIHLAFFDLGEALQRCSVDVESVARVMQDRGAEVARNDRLREETVTLLGGLADLLDLAVNDEPEDERVEAVSRQVTAILELVDSPALRGDETRYVVGSVAISARSCLEAFVAAQRRAGPDATRWT